MKVRGNLIVVIFIFSSLGVMAQISASKHNFSASGWALGEICLPCHTPHNSKAGTVGAPLWNHEITGSVFVLYNSPTMNAVPQQPGQVSRLCLSCHDGVMAVDSFGGAMGGIFMVGNPNLTTDLSDDHPISIEWDHSALLPGAPGSMCANCHGFDPSFVRIIPFFNKRVECASCHDPHNTGPEVKLLRKTLTGSELCLHCHHK